MAYIVFDVLFVIFVVVISFGENVVNICAVTITFDVIYFIWCCRSRALVARVS